MSTGTDIVAMEKMIKYIESRINQGIWYGAKNLEIEFYLGYTDTIIKRIEKAPPSTFVHLYVEQKDKVTELRRRWRAAKDLFSNHEPMNIPDREVSHNQ